MMIILVCFLWLSRTIGVRLAYDGVYKAIRNTKINPTKNRIKLKFDKNTKPLTVNLIFASDLISRFSREREIRENKSPRKCPNGHSLHGSSIVQLCSPRKSP